MYVCKQCTAANPLDSSFCKKCGVALPEDDIVEARKNLQEVIEEGNNLFTAGRIDEAMLIAEAACRANPSNHMALSLKGLCHERNGEVAEALECYEAAVALNPDGTLDKIKVNALRNRLAQRIATDEVPDRRRAMIMAGSAVMFVVAVGSLLAVMASRGHTEKVALNQSPSAVEGFDLGHVSSNQAPATQSTANSGAAGVSPVASGSTNSPQAGQGTFVRTSSNYQLPPAPSGILPIASETGLSGPLQINPENPGLPPTTTSTHTSADQGVDPAPSTQISTGPAAQPAPPENHGIIDIGIAPTTPSNPNHPGAQPLGDSNGLEALRSAAQTQFQLGRYPAAAASYQKVARAGGDGPQLRQRLGQCYERMGDASSAVRQYNLAIHAYESAIKAGRNVPANQAGLNVCTQALKVLGG